MGVVPAKSAVPPAGTAAQVVASEVVVDAEVAGIAAAVGGTGAAGVAVAGAGAVSAVGAGAESPAVA